MKEKRHTGRSADGMRKEWRMFGKFLTGSVASGLAGIALSLLGAFLSFFVSRSKSPDVLSINHNLLYLAGGIVVLGIVTVAIASFKSRRNRDVILLEQRLAKIYLSALRQSALNPQLESPTSHE